MTRRALLLANSVGYGERSKYPRTHFSTLLNELANTLSHLGDYSFGATVLPDLPAEDARTSLRKSLKAAANGSDLLLFYYFGHGVFTEHGLHFFFKDSEVASEATMLGFEELVSIVRGYHFGKVAFVLDCCYAGTGADRIQPAMGRNTNYCLMAAATGKANTLATDRSAMGIFTEQILRGFRDRAAATGYRFEVTFKSLFSFTKKSTRELAPEQEPYFFDGGLADEVLLKQESKISVTPTLDSKVPPKTSYMKLYLLGGYIADGNFKDVEGLYSFAKSKNDKAFQTPIKTERGTSYRFISLPAFEQWVFLLRDLGAVEADSDLMLSERGSALMAKDGARFNQILWDLVRSYWATHGFVPGDVLEAIAYRVQLGVEPTAAAIHRFLFNHKRIALSHDRVRKTLDLAGYTGAIPYCSQKTFYPVR